MSEGEKVQKYDVVVPPGVPQSILNEIVEKFDVDVVDRPRSIKIGNMDGDVRNLIAFRCDLQTAQEVEKYIYDELHKFISE